MPYTHAKQLQDLCGKEMSEHGTECSLLLSSTMTHNEFDIERDFLEPLQHFLTTNHIEYNTKEKMMTTDFGSTIMFN